MLFRSMKHQLEPFALMLYRRHQDGESIRQIAEGFGIPEDRVNQRIRAAAAFEQRRKSHYPLESVLEFARS